MYSLVHFSEAMSSIVTIPQGALQGRKNISYNGTEFHSFEGIPYAAPPVGRLRFQPPQEPSNWQGVRDATEPGPKCAQMDPYGKKSLDGSEDCLYLNVHTPSLPQDGIKKLPVLVFVHGGRLIVGNGHYYKPDYFMDKDVILVTINYRLHVLGFLCLNIPEAPGNAALKDVCFALKWVKKNITFFNGDVANVTAFGESAGGGLITSLLTSKMADGLVDKIITESGVCLSDLMMVEEDPIEKARHVASLLGKELKDEKSLHEFLMQASVEDLVFAATMAELSRPEYIINAYYLPVVEKKFDGVPIFFEEYPLITMLNNRQKNIPILVGLNSHEGAFFARTDEKGEIRFLKDLQRLIPRYLSIEYNSPKSRKIAENLHEFYFQRKEINDQLKNEYINLTSDAYFNRDVVIFAEINAKINKNIYFYNFCYSGNMNTRIMKSMGLKGATHGDMLQYQFYREAKAKNASESDKRIVEFLSEAWCNFARNGKPSTKTQHVEWPPYTPNRLCMNIDKENSVTEYPNWPRIKFWLDIMGERAKL